MKAHIDKRFCPAANQYCKPIATCPEKAILWIEDEDEPFGVRAEIDSEKYTGCGVCVPPCCSDCIKLS